MLPDATVVQALCESICASPTLPEPAQALLGALRCTHCGALRSTRLQQHMRANGAPSAVLHGLRAALAHAAPPAAPTHPPPACPAWLPPLTASLRLLVVGAPASALGNVAFADAWAVLKSGASHRARCPAPDVADAEAPSPHTLRGARPMCCHGGWCWPQRCRGAPTTPQC